MTQNTTPALTGSAPYGVFSERLAAPRRNAARQRLGDDGTGAVAHKRTPALTSGEEETMTDEKTTAEPSRASGGSGDDGTGEEGFLRCSVAFDIDGHKVKASHAYDYQSQSGLASMGWVWGIGVGDVLLSLRPYMNKKQWDDFVDGIKHQLEEYENG